MSGGPDYLSVHETQACQPGQVVVNAGADVWVTWANGGSVIPGAIIGLCLKTTLPGSQMPVLTVDRFPYNSFNLGPGLAGPVSAGVVPFRGSNVVIGSCDAAGEIVLSSTVTPSPINVPILVPGLRALSPSTPHVVQVVDGYAAAGDGGGGVFIWNSVDTRPDNGGTILKYSGLSTGRWNRVLEQNGWNVQWFGATGLGVVDDGPAINVCTVAVKAEIDRIGATNPEISNGPFVLVPRGRYLISTTVEMPQGMWMRGEGSGDQTIFFDPTGTVHMLRMSAHNNGVEGMGFMLGKSGIVMWGNSVHFGNLDVTTSFGNVHIRNCRFRANAFPSIYLDTSTAHRGSPSTLVVDHCDFYTGTVYYGGFDGCHFTHCNVQSTDAPGSGPIWAVATPRDSLGHRLGIWNSYDSLTVDECFVTPSADGTAFPSTYVIRGCGNITMSHTHVGGESSLGAVQTIHDSLTFDGQPLSTVAFGSGVEVRLFDNILACLSRGSTAYVSGRNVIEIVDIVPAIVDIRQSSPNGTAGLAGLGIWIDSATVPKSAYTALNQYDTYWSLTGLPNEWSNIVRTSTDPQSQDGENVSPYFTPYMSEIGWTRRDRRRESAQSLNLWPSGKVSYAQADAMPGSSNGALGAAETLTGYGLVPWVATAFPSNVRADYYHVTDGLPRGIYTLSFSILSDSASTIQVRNVNNASVPQNIFDVVPFDASAEYQRRSVTFYHDGTTSRGVAFTSFALPATAHFTLGMFQLEPGDSASPYRASLANVAHQAMVTHYYVAGLAPSSGGPYRTGDVAWNIRPDLSNVDYWRCASGGSPGTWVQDPGSAVGHGTASQAYITNAAGTAAAWTTFSGDVAPTVGTPGFLTVVNITGTAGLATVTNGTSLAFGAIPAASGLIRLPTAFVVMARNHANSRDLSVVQTDSADNIIFGDGFGNDFLFQQTSGQPQVLFSHSGYNAFLKGLMIGNTTPSVGGATGGFIGLQDAIAVPTSNPTNGGVIYSELEALKWRSPLTTESITSQANGTVNTQLGTSRKYTSYGRVSTSGTGINVHIPLATTHTSSQVRVTGLIRIVNTGTGTGQDDCWWGVAQTMFVNVGGSVVNQIGSIIATQDSSPTLTASSFAVSGGSANEFIVAITATSAGGTLGTADLKLVVEVVDN